MMAGEKQLFEMQLEMQALRTKIESLEKQAKEAKPLYDKIEKIMQRGWGAILLLTIGAGIIQVVWPALEWVRKHLTMH
jgi:prefoldin subunit 5